MKLLAELTLPEGLQVIEQWGIYWSPSLTSLELPSTLEQLESFAFYGCAIEEITLTSNNLQFESSSFSGLSSLKNFHVNADNQSYASVDCITAMWHGPSTAIFSGMPAIIPAAFEAEEPLAYTTTLELPNTVINPRQCKLIALLLDGKGNEVNADCQPLPATTATTEPLGIARHQAGCHGRIINELLLPYVTISRYADSTTLKVLRR